MTRLPVCASSCPVGRIDQLGEAGALVTPGGVPNSIRISSRIAITTPMPNPRETTQTAVKARALKRVRAALVESRKRPLIPCIYERGPSVPLLEGETVAPFGNVAEE